MRSQSHKCGSLYSANLRENESMNSKLARDHINKLLLEVALDIGLNLIVKTSILYSKFVLP